MKAIWEDNAMIEAESFARCVRLLAGLPAAESARLGYDALIDELSYRVDLATTAKEFFEGLPACLAKRFADRGWEWNGFYYLRADADGNTDASEHLDLGFAHGPPVCTPLERRGDRFTSGMCWDAMLSNFALLATDVAQWPGYVSCDGSSGIRTQSSIVVPLRGPNGAPLGVWDVDARETLELADVRAMDAIMTVVTRIWELEAQDLTR